MSTELEITDDYIKEVNEAYWQEMAEYKMGIHPLQNQQEREEDKIDGRCIYSFNPNCK